MRKIKAMTKDNQPKPGNSKFVEMLIAFLSSNTFTKILGMLLAGSANGSLILAAVMNGIGKVSKALNAEKPGYKFVYWVSFASTAVMLGYAIVQLTSGNPEIASDVLDAMNGVIDSTAVDTLQN